MLITRVTDRASIALVAALAREIWTEHYEPIIGRDQVEYMLRTIQSEQAIGDQIDSQCYDYYLMALETGAVGYIGVQDQGEVLLLSKVYVRAAARGMGLGQKAVEFVRAVAAKRGHRRIRLTVNKHNDVAISAYERLGFSRVGTQVADIGDGFVMDDYVYEVSL